MHKILIVDDEEEILEALDTYLSLNNFQVKTVSSAEDSVKLLRSEKFHIVITDINMPRITGIELLKEIKKVRPFVQVIMITAYTTVEKAIDCWQYGASDYILKPFKDLDEILKIVSLTSERISRWEQIAKLSIKISKNKQSSD